jgi:hypothetical protein
MATHPIGESKHPSICVSSVLVPLTDRSAIAASGEVEPQLLAHYRSIVSLSSLRGQTWGSEGSLIENRPDALASAPVLKTPHTPAKTLIMARNRRDLPSTTPARRGTGNNRSGTKRDGTVQRHSVVRDGLLAYPMTQ